MEKMFFILELFFGITFIIGAIFCVFIKAPTGFMIAVFFSIKHLILAYKHLKEE